MENVVEIALFKIQENISDDSFISLSKKFNENFVIEQNGFIERKLVKSEKGIWADIVTWETMDCAMQVEKNMSNSSYAREYMSCIKENSVIIHRMSIIDINKKG